MDFDGVCQYGDHTVVLNCTYEAHSASSLNLGSWKRTVASQSKNNGRSLNCENNGAMQFGSLGIWNHWGPGGLRLLVQHACMQARNRSSNFLEYYPLYWSHVWLPCMHQRQLPLTSSLLDLFFGLHSSFEEETTYLMWEKSKIRINGDGNYSWKRNEN